MLANRKDGVLSARVVRPAVTVAAASTDVETSETALKDADGKDISGAGIRRRFLEFYESRGHARLPSSSLVPEDPTVLLTIAGMLQFKPVFMGQEERKVPCATTTQKCVRTNDIENVGVTARHHTFFEMLGNFSFGDYFKKEAIQWAWELATKEYGLDASRVWVSVFREDDEAYNIWKDVVGVPEERIKRMDEADNYWAAGPTGPCGPCSELYWDFHPERGTGPECDLDDDSRFIEFYNLVFMEFSRSADGTVSPLARKNIDTGMGLERMAQILQEKPNNYETDLIRPIIDKAASMAGMTYDGATDAEKLKLKVIGDHVRAVSYLIADGDGGDAILIDPVLEMVDRDLRLCEELGVTLKYVLNTHCHADHITGSGLIKKKMPSVKSVIAEASGAKADVKVKHGDRVSFGDLHVEVRATPGHTAGCVSYVFDDKVFTGDALLIRGCGRTDFQEGSSETLYDAEHSRIFTLPDDTVVYPAHDYKGHRSSTVGEEKRLNPRLSKSKPEFVDIMNKLELSYPKKIDEALPANMVCGIQD